MNTNQIERLLGNIPGFLGVFASDEITPVRPARQPQCLVVNLDPSWKKGSHWIAVCVTPATDRGRSTIEIFDSYGTKPELVPEDRRKWLVLHNTLRFQRQGTKTCGHYCVYYVSRKLRDRASLEEIVNDLKTKRNPDKFVKSFVERNFRGTDQCCTRAPYRGLDQTWLVRDLCKKD